MRYVGSLKAHATLLRFIAGVGVAGSLLLVVTTVSHGGVFLASLPAAWVLVILADVLDVAERMADDASATREHARISAEWAKRDLQATFDVEPTPSQSRADQIRR